MRRILYLLAALVIGATAVGQPVSVHTFAKLVGFQRPKTFYSPKYETKAEETGKFDLRSTLFWSPQILVGKEGKSSVEFYTSDAEQTFYNVNIEGINLKGNIVKGASIINVE